MEIIQIGQCNFHRSTIIFNPFWVIFVKTKYIKEKQKRESEPKEKSMQQHENVLNIFYFILFYFLSLCAFLFIR